MEITRDLRTSLRNCRRKYARIAFEHESILLVIIIVAFILFSGLVFYFSGDRLQEINNLDSTASIDIQSFTVEPYNEGQIWELDEQVRVYGTFKIVAPSYIERVEIPGQLSRGFTNRTVTINSAYLRTGRTVVEFHWNNSTTEIVIIVSHSELIVFKWMNFLGMITWCMLVFMVSIPFGDAAVVGPSWDYLTKKAYKNEMLDIEYSLPDWSLAIERSSKLISHLSGRTDYYRGLRGSLMSIIGILYTACLGLLTFILTSNIDPTISEPIILYIVLTMVILARPVHLLVKSTTDKFLPISPWFFKGRISAKPASADSYEFDIDKNIYQIAYESEKGIFMDNLRELVSLYYILRNAKSNYSSARKYVGYSVFTFITGFGISIFVLFDIMDFIVLVLVGMLLVSIIIIVILGFWSWMRFPTEIEVFTLFYDPDVLKNKDWQQLHSLLERVDHDNVRLVPTSKFNNDMKKKIRRELYSVAKRDMNEKNLKLYSFSRNLASFGSKYIVMIVRKIGKLDNLLVYPHYKIEDGSKILVEAYEYGK